MTSVVHVPVQLLTCTQSQMCRHVLRRRYIRSASEHFCHLLLVVLGYSSQEKGEALATHAAVLVSITQSCNNSNAVMIHVRRSHHSSKVPHPTQLVQLLVWNYPLFPHPN